MQDSHFSPWWDQTGQPVNENTTTTPTYSQYYQTSQGYGSSNFEHHQDPTRENKIINLNLEEAEESFAIDFYSSAPKTYTPIGQLVHDLKYQKELHDNELTRLTKTIAYILFYFLSHNTKISNFDAILPVPSYAENPSLLKNKPVYRVAAEFSKISSIQLIEQGLKKNTSKQAKNSKIDQSAISCTRNNLPENILLIDDLFQSGDSAKYSINAIKSLNPHCKITFISFTKNKHGGIPKHYKAHLARNSKRRITKFGSAFYSLTVLIDGTPKNVNIFENATGFKIIEDLYRGKQYDTQLNIQMSKNDKGYWSIKEVSIDQ
ncbi:hypothetical protein [Rothia nasimurium]|uniref:hypothetical protein n=1 Tax=Rothia nasimurium TaxID=85336 RepID=UPI001F47FC14|nr:hypothetical protein [Rothia nasimurium]